MFLVAVNILTATLIILVNFSLHSLFEQIFAVLLSPVLGQEIVLLFLSE